MAADSRAASLTEIIAGRATAIISKADLTVLSSKDPNTQGQLVKAMVVPKVIKAKVTDSKEAFQGNDSTDT